MVIPSYQVTAKSTRAFETSQFQVNFQVNFQINWNAENTGFQINF